VLTLLTNYLVALTWIDAATERVREGTIPEAFDVTPRIATAFVVAVGDEWFLLTAGHTLADLKAACQSGRRIIKARLIDSPGRSQQMGPIPFDFDLDQCAFVDADGLDYGLIHLRFHYAELLRKGERRAFDRSHWGSPSGRYDDYVLLGFPSSHRLIRSTRVGPETTQVDVASATPLLPLQPTPDPPECLVKAAERFYAKVPRGLGYVEGELRPVLDDIEGMSGGPVVGVRYGDDGTIDYELIAVQSTWAKDSRVLAACPVQKLLSTLEEMIDAESEPVGG
jgi:hypothetical protein